MSEVFVRQTKRSRRQKLNLDSGAKNAFRSMILEHYFETLEDRDARTSGAKTFKQSRVQQRHDTVIYFSFKSGG